MVLSSLIISSSAAQFDDYNVYSNIYNVWSYSFDKKKYEEEYSAQQQNPSDLNTNYVYLYDLNYRNGDFHSTIVSPQFTAFLESLTETEYEIAIKPILVQAIANSILLCDYYDTCERVLNNHYPTVTISTPIFTESIKYTLKLVLHRIQSSYLQIFLSNQLYLWYDMYWSLNTTSDNQPVITYDHFNNEYRMCFYKVPIHTVLSVRDTMKSMLETGSTYEEENFLHKIAKPWLDCIDREYQDSMDLLKTDNQLWVSAFLYNISTYTQAVTMIDYMFNNLQNNYYQIISPHTIKNILDKGKSDLSFKPMIYSLYLSLFLEPYIGYIKQIQADVSLFKKETGLANLTLDITTFNESVPLDNRVDKIATDFIASSYHKGVTTNDRKNNTNRLAEFVKFATKDILSGNKAVHYSIFKTHQDDNLDSAGVNLMYNDEDFIKKLERSLSRIAILNKRIEPFVNNRFWTISCQKIPPMITEYNYRHTYANSDINYLRGIAPNASETKKLLWIVHRVLVARRPPKFDIQQLNNRCKTFAGNMSIASNSSVAAYLAQIIDLYFELRYLRPYDFYSEEKNTVKFIKFAYNLHSLRYFTYFQAHMIMYLQYIISTLADPNFKYTQTSADNIAAKIQYLTLDCELKFHEKEMTSLLINLRTISGGNKLLNRYAGESGIIYRTFMNAMEQKTLNNDALQTVYRRYRAKNYIEILSIPIEKLYSELKTSYFRIYASLQDPVIFAKIVDDLLLRTTYRFKLGKEAYYM